MNKDVFKSKCKINNIGITDDTLTGRGGIALFVKYLSNVEIYPLLQEFFGDIKKAARLSCIFRLDQIVK